MKAGRRVVPSELGLCACLESQKVPLRVGHLAAQLELEVGWLSTWIPARRLSKAPSTRIGLFGISLVVTRLVIHLDPQHAPLRDGSLVAQSSQVG